MELSLRAPDDFHVHLRQAPMLEPVVRETARWFDRVLAMPNTVPPITTPERLVAYGDEIRRALLPGESLTPILVFKVVPDLDPATVDALAAAGAVGGKLYPQGVTTNSADGVADADALFPVYEAMEALDLVLEVHAELPGAFSLDREAAFLPVISRIATRFPRLRIVIEHVSSAAAVRAIHELPPTVAATVTVHHLMLTLDDVVGGDLRPHHFCKPIAKRPEDRDAILAEVLAGNPRFFFGSDSAPHLRGEKESECGCAGVYTAPVAVPLLVELFAAHAVPLTEAEAGGGTRGVGAGGAASARGEADGSRGTRASAGSEPSACASLESFLSRYGAEFYRLPLNGGRLELARREWVVPNEVHGVVPFRAGDRLRYALSHGGTDES